MRIDILTILPDVFNDTFSHSILKRAIGKGIVKIQIHDIRKHSTQKQKSVDDYQYGGGAGMVMTIQPIDDLISKIPSESILKMPAEARVEGGDVMLSNACIFVGYSEKEDFEKYIVARTNRAGLDSLKNTFPNKRVKGFELNKSDIDPRENALHLDCCFQPIGKNSAILYKGGFKNESDFDFLVNYFGAENIIEVSKEEMYNMNANVFSISEKVIVSEKGFKRLNAELRKRGFIVEEVPYAEIAKMEGLLRCSTIPLIRD